MIFLRTFKESLNYKSFAFIGVVMLVSASKWIKKTMVNESIKAKTSSTIIIISSEAIKAKNDTFGKRTLNYIVL